MGPKVKRLLKALVQSPPGKVLASTVDFVVGLMAPIVWLMARTGLGTNACLKGNALPVPVHYYSPIPDLNDLRRRDIWARRSELAGIDFRKENQLALLAELGEAFGHECRWDRAPGSDPRRFYTPNNSFSFGCAAALHSLIRRHKPRNVIEIGSGRSSLVLSGALERNRSEGHPAEYVIVDPFPSPLVADGLPSLARVHRMPVEQTELALHTALGEDDVLFIDSGHTVKTGGDVNFEILEILPRLAPGVLVHFHDIPLPFEYPEIYFSNPTFRVFWTEAYLLQAFLCGNKDYEILLTMNHLMIDEAAAFRKAFAHAADGGSQISGSFWIRRRLGMADATG